MSVVYAAVHAFENSVRATVIKAMGEKHGAMWWDGSLTEYERRQNREWKRMRSFAGTVREVLARLTTATLEIYRPSLSQTGTYSRISWGIWSGRRQCWFLFEKSRNIVMHGGSVAKEDVERIGMNIRDWIRQAG